jgi:hypothetical protein
MKLARVQSALRGFNTAPRWFNAASLDDGRRRDVPRNPRCAPSTPRASPDDARRRGVPTHSALRGFNSARVSG